MSASPSPSTAIPEDVMATAIRALHSDEWDTPAIVIARVIMAAKADERQLCDEQLESARQFVKRHPALSLIDLAEFEVFLKIPTAIRAGA